MGSRKFSPAVRKAAIRPDGTVALWGYNPEQALVPDGLSNVVDLALGPRHAVALRSDGSLFAWGSDEKGQLNIPTAATNIIQIAAGEDRTIAVTSYGTALQWGDIGFGHRESPQALQFSVVTEVAASADVTMALAQGGSIYTWSSTRLSSNRRTIPTAVAIATSSHFQVALSASGRIEAWYDGARQFGYTLPFLGDITNAVAVAAGDYHMLALKSDGTVSEWDFDGFRTNTTASALRDVIGIAAGDRHSVALKSDGTIVVWEDLDAASSVPMGIDEPIAVAASGTRSLSLEADGTITRGAGMPKSMQTFLEKAQTSSTSQLALSTTWA